MKATRLSWLTFLRIYCRSFLLQASWNFEKLQNLGFLYLVLPGLRSIYGDELSIDVQQRQVTYFNTHPYFAPLIAGTILRMEERLYAGGEVAVDPDTYKKMVMAPFAAMGDALFGAEFAPWLL